MAREHTGTGEPANKLRNKLRDSVRDHIFDVVSMEYVLLQTNYSFIYQATLWDQAYDGFSIVLHMDGTTIPNAPALPEYLKAHVYLPPSLVNEFTESHEPIANIVQTFIESIGVPTVMRWRRAASNNNWSLTQTQSGGLPAPSPLNLPLIPNPTTPTSSYYIFPGHPYRSLQLNKPSSPSDLRSSSPSNIIHSPPSKVSQLGMPDMGFSSYSVVDHGPDIDAIIEENTRLNKDLSRARVREADHEATIANLREEIRNFMT
jgi:hypothetical protein